MNRDDADLAAAVRAVAEEAHRPGPAGPALARTRRAVTAGEPPSRGRARGPGGLRLPGGRWRGLLAPGGRWSGVLVPATVAATVVALVVGAVALFGPGGGLGGGPNTGGGLRVGPGANPDPSATAGPAVLGQSTPVAAAWAALVAAGGGAMAATPTAGQLIYTCTDGVVDNTAGAPTETGPSANPNPWELQFGQVWLDPQGAIPLMIKVNGEPMMFTDSPKDNSAQQIADARDRLAQEGPNSRQPTPQWLASLPTDPDALLAALRAEASAGGGTKWSVDHEVWTIVGDLLHSSDGLLPPAQRVALYGAMSKMDGLSAYTLNVQGRALYSIRRTEENRSDGLLFDPATGRSAGVEDAILDSSGAPTLSYQALSCWAVVDAVGETG